MGDDELNERIDELALRIEKEIQRNSEVLERVGEFEPRSVRVRQAEQFLWGDS